MKRRTKQCHKCKRDISLSNITRHIKSCNGTIKAISDYVQKKYNWSNIQSDYDNEMSYRDITAKHGVTQQAIAKAMKRGDLKTRSLSEAGYIRNKKYGPTVMGKEARKRLSKRMSEHNPCGKSKWYTVAGKKVQGTWERDFALLLEERGIEWTRCKPWKYIMRGKEKRYTPDFYLPEKDKYIEIKGYWWGNDREKMDCVLEQHPHKNILIIEDNDFSKHLDGEIL